MPEAAAREGTSAWQPIEIVGVVLLVAGLGCAVAMFVLVKRRPPESPFAGVENEGGLLRWLFYSAVVLVPTALIFLIAGSRVGGPPEEGDPCQPGQTPPPGFVCE